MWTLVVAKNKKKFGHVTHVFHGLSGKFIQRIFSHRKINLKRTYLELMSTDVHKINIYQNQRK